MTATQAQQMADKMAEMNKAQQKAAQEQGPLKSTLPAGQYTSGYLQTLYFPQTCPTCGKCPTCGRGGYQGPYYYNQVSNSNWM